MLASMEAPKDVPGSPLASATCAAKFVSTTEALDTHWSAPHKITPRIKNCLLLSGETALVRLPHAVCRTWARKFCLPANR